ncbi:hypothetical protein HK102_010194, partial [Quaeritorhiza haematococci]
MSYQPVARDTNQQPPTKVQIIQDQVQEVVAIAQDNVNKLVGRGESLAALENKTQDLSESANRFKKQAKEVRK